MLIYDSGTKQKWPCFGNKNSCSVAMQHIYKILFEQTHQYRDVEYYQNNSFGSQKSLEESWRTAQKLAEYVISQNIFMTNNLAGNFKTGTVKMNGSNWYDQKTGRQVMSKELGSAFLDLENRLYANVAEYFPTLIDDETGRAEKINSIQKISEIAKNWHAGTCIFLSAVGYDYWLTLGDQAPPCDLYYIENGSHVFLILGRDPKCLDEDYTKWKNAVVCDLWNHQIFPASDMNNQLHDYHGCDESGLLAVREKFNPQNQRLRKIKI